MQNKKILVIIALVSGLLCSCGGGSSSSSSASNVTTLGTASLGTSAELSTQATGASIAVPIFNNSLNSVIINSVSIISGNSDGVTLDLGACANKILASGEECNLLATYAGKSTATGAQKVGYSIKVNQGTTYAATISGILDYEAMPNSYNEVFLAQSLYPIVLNSNSNTTYTSLWLYNASSESQQFSGNIPFVVNTKSGSGTWSVVSTSCQTNLAANSGCYAVIKYTNNQANLLNNKNHSNISDAPLSSVKITANLTGISVYTDLSVDAGPSSSSILLSPININSESSISIPIINSGNLPITQLTAGSSNTNFNVDYSNCTNELPLSPGSDICHIIITKNGVATGSAALNINYADSNGEHSVSNSINYSSLIVSPTTLIFNTNVSSTTSQQISLTNVGSESIIYESYTKVIASNNMQIDDSTCIGQSLGSCSITVTYSPTQVEQGQGSIIFTGQDRDHNQSHVTAFINYHSTDVHAPDIEFCSDISCNTIITTDQISALVNHSQDLVLYAKNVGSLTTSDLSLAISPSVSGLQITSNQCAAALTPGSICQFNINFAPTVRESGNTAVQASYDHTSSSLTLHYLAETVGNAKIVYCNDSQCTNKISAITLNTLVNQSLQYNVYIENIGTGDATEVAYALAHSVSGLTVDSSLCPSSLPANSPICNLKLTYNPTSEASGAVSLKTSYINVATGDSMESDLTVNYNATQPSANLEFCADSVCQNIVSSVTIQTQPNQSATKTVYVKNIGTGNTGAIISAFTNQVAGLIAQNNSCTQGLSSTAICSFTLNYQPSAITSGNTNYKLTDAHSESFALGVTYISSSTPSSDKVLAGYLSTGYMGPPNNYLTIGQAAQVGYNVVILAFGKLDSNQNMSFYNQDGMGFLAYDGGISTSGCAESAKAVMLQDIANSKSNGSLKYTIISLGGANSTFTQPMTDQQINTAATNIVAFLNSFYLDGVDFDLEQTFDGAKLHQLLLAIKSRMPGVILTTAPQMNTTDTAWQGNPYLVSLVSTGHSQDYKIPVESGDFTYIWPQAYNTGSGSNLITYYGIDTSESMVEYIPAAYNYFVTSGNQFITIPENSKFLLGEPATPDDGGDATVWHNSNYPSQTAVYTALESAYQGLGSNLKGAMAWTINRDVLGNCQFAKSIGGVVGTTFVNCPTNTSNYWVNVCHW